MLRQNRSRGHSKAALRFCIECGLTIPWKKPGARGYNRGAKIHVMGLEYKVCNNCGLFERQYRWASPRKWHFCPHGYESNRKNVARSEDLAKWKVEYQKAAEERDYGDLEQNERKYWIRRSLEMHGLHPSCL